MVEYTLHLISALDIELETIKTTEQSTIEICKKALVKISSSCNLFKEKLTAYSFKSKKEELFLFKELKPKLFGQLFYFNKLFKIECEKPNVVIYQKKYFEEHLIELHKHFKKYKAIYAYYRLGETSIDETCFVRTNQGEIMYTETGKIIFYEDDFLVINDLAFATILANDLTERYLQFEIDKLNELNNSDLKLSTKSTSSIEEESIPEWKESRVAYVELLYFLYCSGGFGEADLKSIARGFRRGFNIEIGDPYKVYNELRMRNNKTKFIDSSRDKFIKKLKDDENNWKI